MQVKITSYLSYFLIATSKVGLTSDYVAMMDQILLESILKIENKKVQTRIFKIQNKILFSK
jgi:hypothetical protein